MTHTPVARKALSNWTIAEFSSALSIKLRTGQIEVQHRNSAPAAFTRLVADSLERLPVMGLHFGTAARLADQYLLGLRTGEALHLAIGIEYGARICTLDRRLSETGSSAGADISLL